MKNLFFCYVMLLCTACAFAQESKVYTIEFSDSDFTIKKDNSIYTIVSNRGDMHYYEDSNFSNTNLHLIVHGN